MDNTPPPSADRPVPGARMAELHFVVSSPDGALQAALLSLVIRVDGARGASLADANGLPIASTLSGGQSDRLASAMAAMVARTARIVLDAMGRNRLQTVVIEGSATVILVCQVGEAVGTLMLVVERTGDLEAAKREIIQTAEEVTAILDLDVW